MKASHMFSMAWVVGLCACVLVACEPVSSQQAATDGNVAIVMHGGAGTILPENMTPELEAQYRGQMEEALQTGHRVLTEGGTSLDAVVAAVQVLEESPLFNAGVGAVYTHEGTHELDASIMEGRTRNAGAVAGVTTVKSPIALARLVMEQSQHVMLTGAGAEAFGALHNIETVPNSYFDTERRLQQLERAKARETSTAVAPEAAVDVDEFKFGTVGAVALDRFGNLAAATSTGGMTNKRYGRIGDSPVVGAGTYADNATCGVSATGHGEYFIRGVVAHDIAAQMRYGNASLEEAATSVIMDDLTEMGGTGGVVAMDAQGNIAMPFNTPGMYRGYIDTEGQMVVQIFKEE